MIRNINIKLIIFFVVVTFMLGVKPAYAESTTVYTINGTDVNYRSDTITGVENYVIPGFKFNTGDIVTYIGTKNDTGGALWYNVGYTYGGVNYTGYVFGTFITSTTYNITSDGEFETYLTNQGFPSSYFTKLKELHSLHPNWVFQALNTGLSWDEATMNESYIGKSLISGSRDVAYRATDPGAYNWDTDTWTALDGSSWFAAKRDTVSYYMDPRNFLNQTNIFMFESLSYSSTIHTKEVVQGILNNTFMSGSYSYNGGSISYADTFMAAAGTSAVSPVHLASRVRQEQGTAGSSKAVAGGYISCWSNYYGIQFNGTNIFNFFNYGAYSGADPACNGLVYATISDGSATDYRRPWNTRYASILGGSEKLGAGYINKGQNTMYLEKFNVNPAASTPKYTHQYMTNIEAPKSESTSSYNSYSSFNALSNPFLFIIPVYTGMPDSTSLPSPLGNPNNYLSALTVNGSSVPSFSRTTEVYNINVPSSVTSLSISATKISTLASIAGTGNIELVGPTTAIIIPVTAGNGTVRNYIINVTKSDTAPLSAAELLISLKLVNDNSVVSGIPINTTVSTLMSNVSKINYLATTTIKDVNGNMKASGNLATGDKIEITSNGETLSYTAVIYGDVNGDGVISIKDLLSVQKSILKATTLSGNYLRAADPTKDGSVTIRDLLAVQKHILGVSLISQ